MKTLLNIAIILLCAMTAMAEEAGFQFALFPEVAIHSRETVIHGLTLNVFGQNEQHGLTLGIGNWMTGESSGFSLGWLNSVESYQGVQLGIVNYASENYSGLMVGIGNSVGGTFTGLQLGAFNRAKTCHGWQLGLFNYADDLHGLQIGAINIATKNTWFGDWPNQFAAVFPIVNWSF